MILRFLITVLVYCFFGWLLCDIDPGKEYTWYSGIWHGLFFVVNLIRSWFTDALYKAEYTQQLTMYSTGFLASYQYLDSYSEVLAALEGMIKCIPSLERQFIQLATLLFTKSNYYGII